MKKTFLEFCEPILNEMPYIHYDDSRGHEHSFDMEVEKRTFDELESLLIQALSGEMLIGNVEKTFPMQLKTEEEKQQLINTLLDINGDFIFFAINKYGSKISPKILDKRMPVSKRSPEEIEAYKIWIDSIVKRSKLLSK